MVTTLSQFVGGRNPFSPRGEFQFVPKPTKPQQVRGTTKYDAQFDHLLMADVAMLVPQVDFDAVKKAYQRYAVNKGIKSEYMFRRQFIPSTKAYTVWLEKKDAQEE